MTTLAMATPSISKRARSAPKIRSALSTLLPQSNGNLSVTILMSRRFASAAAVRRYAFHHQAATIMAKAPTSAAPLNAPRPAARPMSITFRFTTQVDPKRSGDRRPSNGTVKSDALGKLHRSGTADHHVDMAAAGLRADEPLAPIGDRRLGAVARGHLGRVGLGPVLAILAPHDEPQMRR